MLNKINYIFTDKDKRHFALLLALSFLVSVFEVGGITLLLPLIDIATNFDKIESYLFFSEIKRHLLIEDSKTFIVLFGSVLILFYLIRTVLNVWFNYAINNFSYSKRSMIVSELIGKYMQLPYGEYVLLNSSRLTKNIVSESFHVASLINSSLVILSESLVFVVLYMFLMYMQWEITIVLTVVFAVKIFFAFIFIKKKIAVLGVVRSKYLSKLHKVLNETFQNMKYLKVSNKQNDYTSFINSASDELSKINIKYNFFSLLPKFVMEFVGLSIIVIIVLYAVNNEETASEVLSIVALFAISFYRMLPSITKILSAMASLSYFKEALDGVYEDYAFHGEVLGGNDIVYENKIEFNEVDLFYEDKAVLKNVCLEIIKGERVGVIGESGSGKSSLINLLLGLIEPRKGQILIDDVRLNDGNITSWRSKIGYIPQQIYLIDSSIRDNIVFFNDYDNEKFDKCIEKANLAHFISEDIDDRIGENGIMLSGGQAQRVAIARALYISPDIIILDEATSALDKETEREIINEIYQLDKDITVIIISHNEGILDKCDKIIRVSDQNVQRIK